MKKIVLAIILLALAAFAVDKLFFAKKAIDTVPVARQQALTQSKNSDAFNTSFDLLLNNYFALKEGVANYDSSQANAAASRVGAASASLRLNEIRGDSTGDVKRTAENFTATISSASKDLVTETDMTKKKRAFATISESLYNLVRTVRYDRQKLYHQHCPMAFNDEEEAWWLSNSNKIDNPYLGRKHPKYKATMTECGDVTDSLDFSK